MSRIPVVVRISRQPGRNREPVSLMHLSQPSALRSTRIIALQTPIKLIRKALQANAGSPIFMGMATASQTLKQLQIAPVYHSDQFSTATVSENYLKVQMALHQRKSALAQETTRQKCSKGVLSHHQDGHRLLPAMVSQQLKRSKVTTP